MDLNALGCFGTIIVFFVFLFIIYAHHRQTEAMLDAIKKGQFKRRDSIPEGQPMPHDMNALMWYDL
jgi:hypothetical protein